MTIPRIMICLFHLTSMIKKVGACGGNSALEVVEMCKGGSTTARHFYLHGSPAGDVQRCDCSMAITGTASSVYFTRAPLTDTTAICGGTLTLPNGATIDCTQTPRTDIFLYPGTWVVSFACKTADVRNCVEVELATSASSLLMKCPNNQTKALPTVKSSFPPDSSIYVYTSQPSSVTASTRRLPTTTITYTAKFTKVPTTTVTTTQTSIRTSTLPWTSSISEGSRETVPAEQTSVTGSLIAGWVMVAILVAVIIVVVVLLIRKQRESNYKPRDTCQKSVSTQTDGGSIYEGLDRSNVTTPDTMYERFETQPTERGVKDYYNIEMDDYANP
ncbi:uncharacterized protein LOC125373419 [Haliotis rufescens]|uniref:uncharacterized protein LOC125373419 n=1 Tax=Haliotis rufescens TaxID=6454 RepID=UPI00201EACD6|nr:uncharacterized protein LOC125373419 [Haliotis rufescens]